MAVAKERGRCSVFDFQRHQMRRWMFPLFSGLSRRGDFYMRGVGGGERRALGYPFQPLPMHHTGNRAPGVKRWEWLCVEWAISDSVTCSCGSGHGLSMISARHFVFIVAAKHLPSKHRRCSSAVNWTDISTDKCWLHCLLRYQVRFYFKLSLNQDIL